MGIWEGDAAPLDTNGYVKPTKRKAMPVKGKGYKKGAGHTMGSIKTAKENRQTGSTGYTHHVPAGGTGSSKKNKHSGEYPAGQ